MNASECPEVSFPEAWRGLRVVLCHDWLTGMRGGEKVLELLCRGFPDAPVYTLFHRRESVSQTIARHPLHASPLQLLPGVSRIYRYLLPLFPAAVRALRLPPCDLVISTSHCVVKSVRPPKGAAHLCYCFTPMRYAWALQTDYFRDRHVAGAIARPVMSWLRAWDRRTASRVDRFVAISRHIRNRIRSAYERNSDVVFPPVDTARHRLADPPATGEGAFDLVVSALVPYKRVDLAVRAYSEAQRPLKVVGTGTEYARLRSMAGPSVAFLGWRSDEEIAALYQACRLLVFPGEEDFGIVPLEAQASGKPVVAYRKGGATETVEDGRTGVFFDAQCAGALLAAVEAAAGIAWDRDAIRRHAEQFGPQRFVDGLAESITACLAQSRSSHRP